MWVIGSCRCFRPIQFGPRSKTTFSASLLCPSSPALAISRIGPHRDLLLDFFRAVRDMTLVITTWILWPLPIAAFALSYGIGMATGSTMVGVLGFWIVSSSGLLILLLLLLYPLTAWLGGISLRRFARGVWPSQTVAVSSRSSLASLPALLQGAEERLDLPSDVAGLSLPLAVSTFKINTQITVPFQMMFLTVLFGVTLPPGYLFVFIGINVLLSFAQPGIPSGSIAMLIPFFTDVGLPAEAVVMIYVVDQIPDIFKTLVNVTADMSVAVIVTRLLGRTSESDARAGGRPEPVAA